MERIMVVTRSFQAGTGEGGKEFDVKFFAERTAKPIQKLLRFEEIIQGIVVVVNGESGNPLAENLNAEGLTPTIIALREIFSKEVMAGRVIPLLCKNWGPNPGSATALNEGANMVRQRSETSWVLNWSPEIEMDGYLIEKALAHAESRNLSVVGFLREYWWEKPAWHVAQNTAALWKLALLGECNGFAAECNGTGRTVNVKGIGEVSVAGMEDFHAMLRIMKLRMENGPEFRWGMVGRNNPLHWDISFEPGSERERRHLIKVARQYQIMQSYGRDIFPELSYDQVMSKFFACYHQD